LGFADIGITNTDLSHAEAGLLSWLNAGMHGEMDYMERYGVDRARVQSFVPGANTVISLRMDYWPEPREVAPWVLCQPSKAYIARYALGRDYHKVMRSRLQKLVDWMTAQCGPFPYRVFTDSAPVMEIALAEQAGLGWRGKHTLLLHREHGSTFFIGEIVCALPQKLPTAQVFRSPREPTHCGTCSACIDVCPTQAIVAPYRLDARRCISYLTIEHKGSIPVEFRKPMGNRIYGCDDCQLVCPWNKFAKIEKTPDFLPRHSLANVELLELFAWDEATFDQRMQGSAIRRIGHERWLRNLAIGLGNAPRSEAVVAALHARADHPSALVREHVMWALAQHDVR
jgi:epoxyqueuosine reductase